MTLRGNDHLLSNLGDALPAESTSAFAARLDVVGRDPPVRTCVLIDLPLLPFVVLENAGLLVLVTTFVV